MPNNVLQVAAARCKLTHRCYVIDFSRVCPLTRNARNLMGRNLSIELTVAGLRANLPDRPYRSIQALPPPATMKATPTGDRRALVLPYCPNYPQRYRPSITQSMSLPRSSRGNASPNENALGISAVLRCLTAQSLISTRSLINSM
jgi:hypothetical protein